MNSNPLSGQTSTPLESSSDGEDTSNFYTNPYTIDLDDVSNHLASMINGEKVIGNYFDLNVKIKPLWRRNCVVLLTSYITEYNLSLYTVPTAVNYLDRYLSIRSSSQSSLIPTAITCLFIASKFHDVSALSIDDLISMKIDNGPFSANFFINMESAIIRALQWNLHPVVSHRIAHYFLIIDPTIPKVVQNQAIAALDIGMCISSFLQYLPSTIAIASIKVAMNLNSINFDSWARQASKVSNLELYSDKVRQCSFDLLQALISIYPQLGVVSTCGNLCL